MNDKRIKLIDRYFVGVLVLILAFGLLIMTSAGFGITSDPYYYLKKQAFFLAVGIALAVFILYFDYTLLQQYSLYIYGAAILMLVLVLVFGTEVRGTTGWISIGGCPRYSRRNSPKSCSSLPLLIFWGGVRVN